MANFAPYQDVIPERERALSPSPTTSPRPERQAQRQQSQGKNIGTASVQSPTAEYYPPGAGWSNGDAGRDNGDVEEAGVRRGRGFGGGREDVDLFETRLGIRMDWEACLAYLALPPVGGVLLLVLEHKSDYVR
jgi:hypothetical protein